MHGELAPVEEDQHLRKEAEAKRKQNDDPEDQENLRREAEAKRNQEEQECSRQEAVLRAYLQQAILVAAPGSLVRRSRASQAEAPAVGKAFLGGPAPQTGQMTTARLW